MSLSEIADNRWELEAAKTPIKSFNSILQLLFFFAFIVGFLYLFIATLTGETHEKSQMEQRYETMDK